MLAFTVTKKETNYDNLLPEEYKKEYVKTLKNEVLLKDIEGKIGSLLDEVKRIDVHQNLTGFSYYTIYGLKDNKPEFVMIKMSNEDYLNETFSFSFCDPYPNCFFDPPPMGPYCIIGPPIGIVCGCYIQGVCIPF